MKELRFLQPSHFDPETLNDLVKCKAYFDWKYENFEEEYKIYCEEKRKQQNEFLNTLPSEKKEYYMKRREEYFEEFMEIGKRYDPVISKALENKDKVTFLKMIEESFKSSRDLLRNMMVEGHYEGSPLEACDIAMKIMNNEGACKINGGGFAGSIICTVPDKYLEEFISKMSERYGDHNVKEVHVRKDGPIAE